MKIELNKELIKTLLQKTKKSNIEEAIKQLLNDVDDVENSINNIIYNCTNSEIIDIINELKEGCDYDDC